MLRLEHERILGEVEEMINLHNHNEIAYPDKFSPAAFDRFEYLMYEYRAPFHLSLFIYGYKDSEKIADDFSMDNEALIDFIQNSKYKLIAERLLIQLAYYSCNKYPIVFRLYLSYLDIITDPIHRSFGTNVPDLRDIKILEDINTYKEYFLNGSFEKTAVLNCILDKKIAQEYSAEIDGFTRG